MNTTTEPRYVSAGDPMIQYFGKWHTQGSRRFTSIQYSACYFNFRGDSAAFTAVTGNDRGIARIYLDGHLAAEVDCYAEHPGEKTVYTVKGIPAAGTSGIHNLVVTATRNHNPASTGCTLEIGGFAAREPLDYPAWLHQRMTEEYAEIEARTKEWAKPESWKPVPFRAKTPDKGVTLSDSPVLKLWEMNTNHLKYCFSLEDYNEDEPMSIYSDPKFGVDKPGKGWSSWLPASNDARLLAGAAQALRWKEDKELRDIVNKIIGDIKGRVRDDGYYNYYPESKSFAAKHLPENSIKPEFVFDAMFSERKNYDRVFWTRAMISAHKAGNPDALNLVRRMYDWFNAAEQYLPIMLYGGNATNGLPGGPLMFHTEAGKPEDIITNERYFDQAYWMEALTEQQPMSMSHYPGERPHCYELLGLETFADEYRATGNKAYLDALLGGWQVYMDNYKFKGGAPAINETGGPYPPKSYYLTTGNAGELCGSVFWIWINHKMMQMFPGMEQYPGEIEETLINTILPCRDEKGNNLSCNRRCGKKDNHGGNCNGCCDVSSADLVSALPELIYMKDVPLAGSEAAASPAGIYINLFIPSSFNAGNCTLRIENEFPYSGAVRIAVDSVQGASRFPVSIRVPAWIDGEVEITVNNGEKYTGKTGSYCHLNRVWHNGDTITFELPLKPRTFLYTGFEQDEGNLNRYGICCGPVLMALTGKIDETIPPRLAFDVNTLEQKLIHRGKLTFDIEGYPDYQLRPYFEIKEGIFQCYPVIEV
jgi:DUF1680 family protein